MSPAAIAQNVDNRGAWRMTARDTPHSSSPMAVFVFIVIGP